MGLFVAQRAMHEILPLHRMRSKSCYRRVPEKNHVIDPENLQLRVPAWRDNHAPPSPIPHAHARGRLPRTRSNR